jgi:hypothetical protein
MQINLLSRSVVKHRNLAASLRFRRNSWTTAPYSALDPVWHPGKPRPQGLVHTEHPGVLGNRMVHVKHSATTLKVDALITLITL